MGFNRGEFSTTSIGCTTHPGESENANLLGGAKSKSKCIAVSFYLSSKYRRKVPSQEVTSTLKEVCCGIGARDGVHFMVMGSDEVHMHFLIICVPKPDPMS